MNETVPLVPADVIIKKRDGGELTDAEIAAMIRGYTSDVVADYQMSALAMAICTRGMSLRETVTLTEQMLASGVRMEWQPGGPVVDKHSTGGLGDKVSLILAPLVACCGLRVPMLSGRGLGITGGTLDKLEAIPGFRTQLSLAELIAQTNRLGCAMGAATRELAPADQRLYQLRDVTGTVESVPLITASILAKKLAESLDCLVLDVKVGSGAFMKTVAEARALAKMLVYVGSQLGMRTVALLTDMNQPLGRMVGNGVEVWEAIDVLQGQGPADVRELTCLLAAELLVAARVDDTLSAARLRLERHLDAGDAWEKFQALVAAQGGSLPIPKPAPRSVVVAPRPGRIAAIDGRQLGQAVIALGGGRKRKEDPINPLVGLELLVRLGDTVEQGQPLLAVFAAEQQTAQLRTRLVNAFTFAAELPGTCEGSLVPPLVYERIDQQSVVDFQGVA